MKNAIRGIAALLLFFDLTAFAGCGVPAEHNAAAGVVGTSPEPQNNVQAPAADTSQPSAGDALSDSEIKIIVDDALLRGGNANMLYEAGFRTNEDSTTKDGYRTIDMENQPQLKDFPDIVDLLRQIKSTDDIKQYFYNTFTGDVAKNFLDNLFGDEMYRDIDGKLYINMNIGAMPFVMAWWRSEPYTVLENTQDRLVVELDVQFFNSGRIEKHPLTIVKSEDKWLLTDSYIVYENQDYSTQNGTENTGQEELNK